MLEMTSLFYYIKLKTAITSNQKAYEQQKKHSANEKATYGMGEDICKPPIRSRVHTPNV